MIPSLALAALLTLPTADPSGLLQVSASATPSSITVAETIHLSITAITPTGWILGDPVPPLTPGSVLGGLTILSSDRSAPVLSADGVITTTFTATLIPDLPGAQAIPSIALSAHGPGGIEETSTKTDPVTITVRSVLDGADAKAFTPSAIRPPLVPESQRGTHPALWIVVGIAIGAAVATGIVAATRGARTGPRNTLADLERDLATIAADRSDPVRVATRASSIIRAALAHAADPRFLTASAGREIESVLSTTPLLTPDERLAIATVLTDAERIACAPAPSADAASRLIDGARTALNVARDVARRHRQEALR